MTSYKPYFFFKKKYEALHAQKKNPQILLREIIRSQVVVRRLSHVFGARQDGTRLVFA
jgi:hypothetical protein